LVENSKNSTKGTIEEEKKKARLGFKVGSLDKQLL
jgi:hypothetical protein